MKLRLETLCREPDIRQTCPKWTRVLGKWREDTLIRAVVNQREEAADEGNENDRADAEV